MNFTLGADPELVCHLNGSFVPAKRFFKYNSSMGVDGCDQIAELRPGYSESPIDLTAKIHTLLAFGHSKVPDLEFIAGHYVDGYPIGGHIHFSIHPETQMVDSLDVVLGSLSCCIDDQFQKRQRIQSGYGRTGAFRKKPYGFEYRVPGSWLLSPATSLVTLTLAKLTVLGFHEDRLDFLKLKEEQSDLGFLKSLKSKLITIPEDCNEGLSELNMLLNKKLDWKQNILPNWGIGLN